MRNSFALRAGTAAFDLDDRAALERRWSDGHHRAVRSAMADERAQIVMRWQAQAATLAEVYGADTTTDLRWTSAPTFGARAIRAGRAAEAPQFSIEIDLGTQYALDDLSLIALCSRSFLRSFDVDADYQGGVLITGDLTPERFWDYGAAVAEQPQPADMMCAIPLDPERIIAASILSTLSLDFIHFHEQCHILLGHLDLLSRRDPQAGIGFIDEVEMKPVLGRDKLRMFEYQADAYALELLFLEHMSPDRASFLAWEKWGGAAIGVDMRAILAPKPDLVAFRRAARVLIVAAGLIALLIERNRPSVGRSTGDHPHPSARLFSLVLGGTSLIEEFVQELQRSRGRRRLSEALLSKMLVTLVYECWVDLSTVAATMGIADPALRYDASAANPLRTPFIEDIFLLFGAYEDVANIARRPRTSAARDFVRMQPRGAEIFAELRDLHRGGIMLEGRL